MNANHPSDPASVYQNIVDEDRPRAFYVDVWDEDTDDLVHAYFGVFHPTGGGLARPIDGSGIHSFGDAERFTHRFGGVSPGAGLFLQGCTGLRRTGQPCPPGQFSRSSRPWSFWVPMTSPPARAPRMSTWSPW